MKSSMSFNRRIILKGHCFKLILSALFTACLLVSTWAPFTYQIEASSLPTGIVYSVPITFTNTQSTPTPAPFQQMISVNSSAYGQYEASNLQNVEFFDSRGAVIPSWLESGNSSTATNTIYWLKLTSGISANSSIIIYMGFAPPSSNLFNNQTIGEAPQLSASYGQYDNGANIFTAYQNFTNSLDTLPQGWYGSGFNNGWSYINNDVQNGWDISNVNGHGVAYAGSNIPVNNQLAVDIQTYHLQTTGNDWQAPFINSASATSYAPQGDALKWLDNIQGYAMDSGATLSLSSGSSSNSLSSFSGVFPPCVLTVTNTCIYSNYNAIISNQNDILSNSGYLALSTSSSSSYGSVIMGYWVRTRAYAPNGVMPSVSRLVSPLPTSTTPSSKTPTITPTNPTISGANVQEQQTSLQLPFGFQTYLFAYGTGGGLPSGPFSIGQYASVSDANGNVVASLAITSQNSDGFTSESGYPVIGGVAVSGFSSFSNSYGSNPSPAATSASDNFSVTAPGSLVVVIAIGGDEQTMTLGGNLNLEVDASYPGSPDNSLVIAHAYPSLGQYTVTENTLQTAAGQDPNNAGDLIGVFVFLPNSASVPSSSSSTSPSPTPSSSPDFKLKLSPITQSVSMTGIGTIAVQIVPINGYSGSVSLSTSGLPAVFPNPSFSPNLITAYANSFQISYLSFYIGSSAQVNQSYSFDIIAIDGQLSHSQTVTILVTKTIGVKNSIYFSNVNQPADSSQFSIQQNFVLVVPSTSGTDYKYWVQNVILLQKTLGAYYALGGYEIWDFTGDSLVDTAPSSTSYKWLGAPQVSFPTSFNFESTVSSNGISMSNSFGNWPNCWSPGDGNGQQLDEAYILNYPPPPITIGKQASLEPGEQSPEFVVVGDGNGEKATFLDSTSGNIQSEVELSGQSWTITPLWIEATMSTLTLESSVGLAWNPTSNSTADFSYSSGSSDSGVFFPPLGVSSVINGNAGAFQGLVSVSISGSSAPDGTAVNVSATLLSSLPTSVRSINLGNAVYYDVKVQGISDGTATISITDTSGQTTLQYWNGKQWIPASDVTVSGNTITGSILVSALAGTPIALGSAHTSISSLLSFPFVLVIVVVIAVIVLVISFLVSLSRRSKRKAATTKESNYATVALSPQIASGALSHKAIQKLQQLKGMLDAGLITQQDYDEQKKIIRNKQ